MSHKRLLLHQEAQLKPHAKVPIGKHLILLKVGKEDLEWSERDFRSHTIDLQKDVAELRRFVNLVTDLVGEVHNTFLSIRHLLPLFKPGCHNR
jgi:hypothetical protein